MDAGRGNYGGPTDTYQVAVGGNVLSVESVAYGAAWMAKSLTFNATGGPTLLRFAGLTEYDATAFVDHVAVLNAVPEPATYAMLVAGLGLLGAAARRHLSAGGAVVPAAAFGSSHMLPLILLLAACQRRRLNWHGR